VRLGPFLQGQAPVPALGRPRVAAPTSYSHAIGNRSDARALTNCMKEFSTVAYKGINDLLDWLQDRRLSGAPDARRLVQALEDLDDQAREAARAGSAPALDLAPLRRMTAGANEDVRKLAIVALARFGDARAHQQLDELIKDPSPAVRETAAETLATPVEPQPAEPAKQPPAPAQPPPAAEAPAEAQPAQAGQQPHPIPPAPSPAEQPAAPASRPRAPRPTAAPSGPAARKHHPRAARPAAAPAPSEAERQRLLDLARKATGEIDCTRRETPEGITLTVRLPRGQKQDLAFDVVRDDDEQLDFIRITARCGPADSGNYRNALLFNQHLAFGAMTLIDAGANRRTFALTAQVPADEATASAIKRRTDYLAATAHKIARQLSGK